MYTNARRPESLDRPGSPPLRIRVDMIVPLGPVAQLVAVEAVLRQLADQNRPDQPPNRGPKP